MKNQYIDQLTAEEQARQNLLAQLDVQASTPCELEHDVGLKGATARFHIRDGLLTDAIVEDMPKPIIKEYGAGVWTSWEREQLNTRDLDNSLITPECFTGLGALVTMDEIGSDTSQRELNQLLTQAPRHICSDRVTAVAYETRAHMEYLALTAKEATRNMKELGDESRALADTKP